LTAYERFIDAALFKGLAVQDRGDAAMVQCPAHDDGRPSLSVKRIEGSVLLYCMANCETADVVDALGMQMSDLFDDESGFTYEYPGGRKVHRTPDKQFRQDGNKADTSLYRADRLVGAGPIWVVEGEKDVLAIESAGGQAVSSPNGASAKPERYDWEPLRGKVVHIVTDTDPVGRKRADAVAAHLQPIAMSVSLHEPLKGKDAADHIASGHTLQEFKCLTTPEILSFSQAMDEWRKWRDSEHIRPIPTPWHELNRKIAGGLHPGRLYVVGARTGSGKSVAGVNMVSYAAENGNTAFIVSVEMPHVEISSRILAAQASVSYENITRRQWDLDDDAAKIDQYIADRRSMPLYICDKATITIEEVAAKCRMLRESKGLGLAFIDYAQLLRASSSSVGRQEQVSHIARSSKLLAMELNIPVILAAQLNRGAEEESHGETRLPKMTDLRESGELEQSADVILLLHRNVFNAQIYVVVPKNRTGKTGQVTLTERFDMARLES
jgi:5S rRNA maturation endonuclease (ribonuclease M5)